MSKLFSFRLHYSRAQSISKLMQQNQTITSQEFSIYQSVTSDWTKIKRLSVVWIPLIGYPVVLMAAIRPKSFWPEYFWTNKDFIQFTYDSVSEQVQGKESLFTNESIKPVIQMIANKFSQINPQMSSSSSLSPILDLFHSSKALSLQSLPYYHLRMLSYSLSITSLPFYNFILPSPILIRSINQYVNDILYDDNLLRNNLNEILELSSKQLIRKCLLRGLLTYQEIKLHELENKKNEIDVEDDDEEEVKRRGKDNEDDIKENMILSIGKWNKQELINNLVDWLMLTEKIIKRNDVDIPSMIAHLIILGYPRKNFNENKK